MTAPPLTIGIIGDFDPLYEPHRATNDALRHSSEMRGAPVEAIWLPTKAFDSDSAVSALDRFDGLWSAPGSPYQSLTGALAAIRFAREYDIPFIGTCGGCQHTILEYARSVMGIRDAAHAEYDPYASTLFITPLDCSLVGKTMPVTLDADCTAARLYGQTTVDERYYCDFGLDPRWQPRIHEAGLRVVGADASGEARVLEIPHLRFFVATVFVPQARSRPGLTHPLVDGFLRAASDYVVRRGQVLSPDASR